MDKCHPREGRVTQGTRSSVSADDFNLFPSRVTNCDPWEGRLGQCGHVIFSCQYNVDGGGGGRGPATLRFSSEASLPRSRSVFTNSSSAGLMTAKGSGEPGDNNGKSHKNNSSHNKQQGSNDNSEITRTMAVEALVSEHLREQELVSPSTTTKTTTVAITRSGLFLTLTSKKPRRSLVPYQKRYP